MSAPLGCVVLEDAYVAVRLGASLGLTLPQILRQVIRLVDGDPEGAASRHGFARVPLTAHDSGRVYEILKNTHGGKRAGAGKPKGVRWPSTVTKEAARDEVRRMVLSQLVPLLEAQLSNAQGLKYLVTRDKKTGKFIRVTEAMAKAKQGAEDGEDAEIIEVWEKDPSVQAFTDLMNRALDKPAEQTLDVHVTGELEVVTVRLMAARKRLAERS